MLVGTSVSPKFLANGGWQVWRYLGVPNDNGEFLFTEFIGR